MESVNVRNLDQIQEEDSARSSRLLTFVLASVGGAAVVVAGALMATRTSEPARSSLDPLAELVAEAKQGGPPPDQLDGRDVTFPAILSDEHVPTTALAAVKDERGRLREQDLAAMAQTVTPPQGLDRLPVAPLPASSVLQATPVTTDPKDPLVALAVEASRPDGEMAPLGEPTGFQIQVASFRDQADADAFVDELRKRGHRAFRLPAEVPGRGLWHRVRIGPFETRLQADIYKKKFERAERVAPYVIDPAQVKRAEEQREAKLRARIAKFGRP